MLKARFSNLVIISIVTIVTVFIMAVGLVLLNKSTENPAHKFLLPKGFSGWVEVSYEQLGFPAIKQEGRYFIYEVPPSGKVVTSSKNVSGAMDFNYVDQDGRLIVFPTDVPMVHGVRTSSDGGSGNSEKLTFFVGTEEQWRGAKEKQTSP